MSLTNVKLPGSVIASLYRQSLVQDENAVQTTQPAMEVAQPASSTAAVEPPEPQPQPVKTSGAYKVLGNNKQHISVVVYSTSEVFLAESDLQFLTKMLGACKLNLADVAIVNHATAEVAIEKLKAQLLPRFVLLFGVEPPAIQLPISFPAFKEQPYAGTTYLYAPALQQLNQENEEAKLMKRKLWDCLKRMFV